MGMLRLRGVIIYVVFTLHWCVQQKSKNISAAQSTV